MDFKVDSAPLDFSTPSSARGSLYAPLLMTSISENIMKMATSLQFIDQKFSDKLDSIDNRLSKLEGHAYKRKLAASSSTTTTTAAVNKTHLLQKNLFLPKGNVIKLLAFSNSH